MSVIQVACKLDYKVVTPASFLFNIIACANPFQIVQHENLVIDPYTPYEWLTLGQDGNRCFRVFVQPGVFTVNYQATIELVQTVHDPMYLNEIPYLQLPADVLQYLNPSRYCESDRLGRFAFKTFGHIPAGYGRVQSVCEWVNKNVEYVPGSTNASSGACDVLLQRAGVCRDFAHLSIALCRALGIPARYIAAYAPGLEPPADFHGVFEAYLSGRWYLFDATKMAPRGGFTRIGTGRDAADASFATIVGQASLTTMQVSAFNTMLQNSPSDISAISTI